jgi:hypothetical protein
MVDSQYRELAPKVSSEDGEDTGASPRSSKTLVKVLSATVIALALIIGVGVRVARLDKMPPALNQDEACDGYDAYSILRTGRDHHGNFMPIVMQGFNDYRMPLLQYSLVPLVGAFGLKTEVVRLGAAIWGILDLAAIVCLAGLMLGWPGAAAAAVFGALSPWHLSFSRFGQEAITGSATVTLAILCLFAWLSRRKTRYLILSGIFLGLSLYSYSVAKLFTPLIIVLLTILYRRELKEAWPKPLIALSIVAVFAIPQVVITLRHSTEMQAQYHNLSLFNPEAICAGCSSEQTKLATKSIPYLLVANFASNFTASFLFLNGDRGDHWTMLHPPNFGELLPEQAPLVVLGLFALLSERRRRIAILILGWLIIAALPAALIKPLGASLPESGKMPTPYVLLNTRIPPAPVTPSLLLGHADSRHDILAVVPWILLSALGFVVLLDLTRDLPVLQTLAMVLLLAGVVFHSSRYLRYYFEDFPAIAAPYFQYGIKEVLQTIDRGYSRDLPVVITPRINQPYIYVLFFEQYAPAKYQQGTVVQQPGLNSRVEGFDRYRFVPPLWTLMQLPHGIFVFEGGERTLLPPDGLIRYPDGNVAYKIVVK